MQNKERDEILIELKTNQSWIMKQLSNHLSHHRFLSYALLAFIGGLITALIVVLIPLKALSTIYFKSLSRSYFWRFKRASFH